MGLRPALSPLPNETSFQAERLSQPLGTPVGMGMSGDHNLGAFGHGLRRPVRLDKLEKGCDLGGSQLNGLQCELMGYVAPPSLMGKRGQRASRSFYNTSSDASLPFPLPAQVGTNLRQPVLSGAFAKSVVYCLEDKLASRA